VGGVGGGCRVGWGGGGGACVVVGGLRVGALEEGYAEGGEGDVLGVCAHAHVHTDLDTHAHVQTDNEAVTDIVLVVPGRGYVRV